jgi:hypothetical protein
MMTFEFHRLRFHFQAEDPVYFPPGKPGNILRGAFGMFFRKVTCIPECQSAATCPIDGKCPYPRVFEPRPEDGPSGFADAPRPFVFRAAHLDGYTQRPASAFFFDIHLFERDAASLPYFVLAFQQFALEGIGPRRGRARLIRVDAIDQRGTAAGTLFDGRRLREELRPILLDLSPVPATKVTVRFITPMELKSKQEVLGRPEFSALVNRARDRISTLRAIYGEGPLDLDFRAFGEKAELVQMTHCEVRHVDVERKSARTGQVHSIGGFVGTACYEGELASFLPFLRAAAFTGVGRQTVWGKGEIAVE